MLNLSLTSDSAVLRFPSWMIAVVVIAACLAVAFEGVAATRDLIWSADQDFSRDMAAAETIASGHVLADPFYPGEWLWYNPLTPAMVATASLALNAPIPMLYARLGAYLNLLAPIAMFALVSAWWGRIAGALSVLAMLFVIPGDEAAWLTASYSPSLYPMNFAQGLLYGALVAIGWAWRRGTMAAFAGAGALGGIVFLGHTAPAVILAAVMAGEIAVRLFDTKNDRRLALVRNSAVFATAFATVAAPLLVSIVWHYKLRILNAAPGTYAVEEMLLTNAAVQWAPQRIITVSSILAVVGGVHMVRTWHRLESRLALFGLTAVLVGLAYSYADQTAAGKYLPPVVPGHHFLYYLRAAEAIGFGVGLAALGAMVLNWGEGYGARVSSPVIASALVVGTAIVSASAFPVVSARIRAAGRASEGMFTDPAQRALYAWLKEHTDSNDVVFADERWSLNLIAPAGRKVVVVGKLFSNPYVDWAERAAAASQLREALARGDWASFIGPASKYRVKYVLTSDPIPEALSQKGRLARVWEFGQLALYQLNRTPGGGW